MLEERVRSAVKDVVYCNVLKDPIMDDPSITYDVVSSTFCLEEACKSQDDLKAAVKRMAGILKPNGHADGGIQLQTRRWCHYMFTNH